MEIRTLDELEKGSVFANQWQKLVQDNNAAGFMQSLEWARFKTQQGLTCKHLGIFQGQKLIGGCILYYVPGESATIMVAPEGPVIPWQDEALAAQCLELIMNACRRQPGESASSTIALRVEPRLPPPLPEVLLEFGRAPVDLVPRETVYIDLRSTPAEILAAMRPKGRYNTRLAERKGVIVREAGAAELIENFYPILCQTGRRDGFAVEPISFFVEMASTLMTDGTVRLLLAEHEGELLGGLVLLIYGDTATYLYGGTSNTKRNLMSGYALQWAALNTAREAGCHWYDMYGFDRFCSRRNRYGRFSKFKSQFGGEVRRYIGAQDYYFLDTLTDTLIKAFNEVES